MSAYEISVISVIGINVILAVSLNMISGFCGQISLGHGAFYGAGAYAAALAMIGAGSVPLALLAAAIVGSVLGIVVGFASLRVRSDFLAVTTIGVNFLFTGFVRKQRWLGGEMGISGIPASGLGANGNMLMILLFAAATVALSLYVNRSWMGFAFRAVGEDEDAARHARHQFGCLQARRLRHRDRARGTGRRPLCLLHPVHHRRRLRLHPFRHADGDGGDRRNRLDMGGRDRRDRADVAPGGDPLRQ